LLKKFYNWGLLLKKVSTKKPKIALLATGGTIAGLSKNSNFSYESGVLDIQTLLSCMGELNKVDIYTKQFSNIDSIEIDDKFWLKMLKEIHVLLQADFDAVVITHGTDTMEESAYFLSLCLQSDKSVILVGAMRPYDALSFDGAKNLYSAIVLASHKKTKGVMVVMNDKIFCPRALLKTHSLNVDTFSSLNYGDLGYIVGDQIFFNKIPDHKPAFNLNKAKSLARVDILYAYVNDHNAISARALFQSGTRAIVIGAMGCGNINKNLKQCLKELMKQGLIVVISSRVSMVRVVLSEEDKALGFISSGDLNPQKARILLSLVLSKTKDPKKIQEYFLKY